MKPILIPVPRTDFDPTEVSVPWRILSAAGISVCFSTPDGGEAKCDLRMLNGTGLGPLAPLLAADRNGRASYREMAASQDFKSPIAWKDIQAGEYGGMILPGGHARGMREYLESKLLQDVVSAFFAANRPVGAICHGVVLAARSKTSDGKSVLYGRKTTALLSSQELTAWTLTRLWLGDYYRTYKQTVESEVKSQLAADADFTSGPIPLFRDGPDQLQNGFVVQDRNYLSARWPGDAHSFGRAFAAMLMRQ